MSKYLVKVYAKTGESISFISEEIENSPFPDLQFGEFLYFHYNDHWELLNILIGDVYDEDRGWYCDPIQFFANNDIIQNFTVKAVPVQAPEFHGLTREEAQNKALEENLSFRVVLEDGMSVAVEQDYNENRINVFLDQGIVYKAEKY